MVANHTCIHSVYRDRIIDPGIMAIQHMIVNKSLTVNPPYNKIQDNLHTAIISKRLSMLLAKGKKNAF